MRLFDSVIFGGKNEEEKSRKMASCQDLSYTSLVSFRYTKKSKKHRCIFTIKENCMQFRTLEKNACTMLCNNNCIEIRENMTTTIA